MKAYLKASEYIEVAYNWSVMTTKSQIYHVCMLQPIYKYNKRFIKSIYSKKIYIRKNWKNNNTIFEARFDIAT